MTRWNVHILTIFPEIFPGPLASSVTGKALKKGLWSLNVHNIRDYAAPPHYSVDERPFGGGAGMLMRADVIANALDKNKLPKGRAVHLTPSGTPFNQNLATSLSQETDITLLCGRYEGIDQRLFEEYSFEEISIGDYVLTGGEIAAITIIDACTRLIPGVLGDEASPLFDSFQNNLLEHKQYTKPRVWRGHTVPDVLTSGHHANIAQWKHEESMRLTKKLRPDLLTGKHEQNDQPDDSPE